MPIRKILLGFVTAFSTILVVSCASDSVYDSTVANEEVAPVMSEAVVITGSRLKRTEADRSEILQQRERRVSEKKAKNKPANKAISWKPSTQANNNAVIKLGENESLEPEAIDVSVQIDGFRARVVIDGFYTNPHSRNLEGSFKFRLPNGAIPYFFAFGETATSTSSDFSKPLSFAESNNSNELNTVDEIAPSFLSPARLMTQRSERWLAPKEALMVSKEKAAFAYNQTVARQVDPALLEWAGAGIFSAKVFPLLAKKTHRVVLGYDLDLREFNGDLFLDLPVTKKNIKKRFNILVNQKGADNVFINQIIKEKLQPDDKISKNNELVKKVIESNELDGIRITIKKHANVTLVGEDGAGDFFAKRITIKLPEEKVKSKQQAIFLLDTSLSGSVDKFHLWVELIDQILQKNESEIKEFAILTASIDHHWWKKQFTQNNKNERKKLNSYLNQLILEGATDLSHALNYASAPEWLVENETRESTTENSEVNRIENQYDLFLLTDGTITWGEKDPFFISELIKKNVKRFHTVNQLYTYRLGQSGENSAFLNHLTREIGGGSYQLGDGNEIDSLAAAHKQVPWKIESVELEGAKDILISGRPKALYSGQSLVIAGRIKSSLGEELNLKLSKAGVSQTVRVSVQNKIDSDLTSRVFGQIAVEQLESIIALERKVAASFANHFRIPGQSSSLLMLESEADYQRYNIKPEEDVYIASHKNVSQIFAGLENGFSDLLSDPKKRFMQQLSKLEKMSFIQFSMPDSMSVLIDDLPKSAFSLTLGVDKDDNLTVKKLARRGIPKNYLEKLNPDGIQYAILDKESKRRLNKYGEGDALKVISTLIEQMPADIALLRDVAFAAESWGLYKQAFQLHLTAANLRPYEPQSYTYLAKLAAKLNRNDLALIYFEIGLASQWSGRFGDYELIHKLDYANFLRKLIKRTEGENLEQAFLSLDYGKLKLKTLAKEVNLTGSDLIVAISWNTDRTDIDLHVVEPSGEECSYEHKTTRSGGFITADVTQGYGPEMYVNKSAPKGRYKIFVNYFSSDQNKLGLKTKVQVRTIRHWGTEQEKQMVQTVVLKDQKEKHQIAKIKI